MLHYTHTAGPSSLFKRDSSVQLEKSVVVLRNLNWHAGEVLKRAEWGIPGLKSSSRRKMSTHVQCV